MSYSQFDIDLVRSTFGIRMIEQVGTFAETPEQPASPFLQETLQFNTPIALAINSEKSRSEMIITPILLELKRRYPNSLSLFSGKEFTVDEARGLNGYCDFLISQSPEQLTIQSPVITIVEAKNENIESGLGQCMAEMVAAQIFNQRRGHNPPYILGSVTTGSAWKFMRLQADRIEIDLNEYFLNQINKILGILCTPLTQPLPPLSDG